MSACYLGLGCPRLQVEKPMVMTFRSGFILPPTKVTNVFMNPPIPMFVQFMSQRGTLKANENYIEINENTKY